MSKVLLEYGALVVEIEEVKEYQAQSPVALTPLPDINGNLVVYESDRLREIPISGRVKSKTEALRLVSFIGIEDLTLTERDGTMSTGWQIRTEPAPVIQRKDGDSVDWSVSFRLWRLP